MGTRARKMVTACVVTVALLTLVTPAMATPAEAPSSALVLRPVQLVEELMALLGELGGWLDGTSLQNLAARGGGTMDPDGVPRPDLAAGGTVTSEGSHSMDPDG